MSEKSADDRFRDDLDAEYEKLIQVIRDALEAKKKVRVQRDCLKCGCKHIEFVEIDNYEVAMKAGEFLANRGIGRPGTVDPAEREVVHEYRLEWVMPDGE